MSEVKPDTPKLCPEPGCGMTMHTGPSLTKDGWTEKTICLRSDDEHRLCAKLAAAEAKVRELEEGDEALLAVLPEDFGAVEYIKHLTAANAALEEKLQESDEMLLSSHGDDEFYWACRRAAVTRREASRKKGAEHGE